MDQNLPIFYPNFFGLNDKYNTILPTDRVNISYSNGFYEANIQKEDGNVITKKGYTKLGFAEMTIYDPNLLDKSDIIDLVKNLYKGGISQTEIAKKLGISQSTVSNYINKYR